MYEGRPHFIYFIANHDSSEIKIGCTLNPRARFETLRATAKRRFGNREILVLGVMEESSWHEEDDLHERFAEFATGNEWFKASPGIYSYLDSVRSTRLLNGGNIGHWWYTHFQQIAGNLQCKYLATDEMGHGPTPWRFLKWNGKCKVRSIAAS